MAQEQEKQPPSSACILGANVYRLRVLAIPSLSRKKLQARTGISHETIRKIEAARDPSIEAGSVHLSTVEALARGFGVPIAELFRWDADSRVVLHGESSSLALLPGGGTGGSYDLPLIAALPGLAP